MSKEKPWDRPWSMEEIISNSEKWSLAGDVALLNTLKSFADNLINRTVEINNNIQNLSKSLDETGLKLEITQNEFHNLRNTQFIESRVYEDDESFPIQENTKVANEEKSDHTEDIKLAAVKGLQVLDKFFEKVEVSVSDSEDEDIDIPNYVLRPKDLYLHRPLPYVIGSAEWHNSPHVGLEDSSDSETEKVSSESDSESEPIIQEQIKTSDTSSELDFSAKVGPKIGKNDSSDSENSVPVQGPISGHNFAEQLAAKLGHVIQDFEEPEVNRRPIQPPKTSYGDIFFDEPPPLDEPKGLFSGGGGLFDDDVTFATPKQESKGLFDDSDEEIPPKTVLPTKQPLFNEEPPEIKKQKEKKPVGGVSIFGGGNIFDKKLLRRQPSSEEEEDAEETNKEKQIVKTEPKKVNLFDSDEDEDLFKETKKEEIKEEKTEQKILFGEQKPEETKKEEKAVKKINLFDDDDLFKDDLFSAQTTKFTSSLFDDIPEDSLFSKAPEKPKSLFDDINVPNTDSINSATNTQKEKPPKIETEKKSDESKFSLFGSSTDLFSGSNLTSHLFDTPQNVDFKASTPQATPTSRLFDSSPPPDDQWDSKSDNQSEEEIPEFEESRKTDLFSEEPPPLDNEIKTKPGKLKHNLNINVGALMPGYVPPKRAEPVVMPTDDVVVTSPPRDVAAQAQNLDETDRVEVLHSVTKGRVKALNRRPSTRKGRKEALKNSNLDFKLSSENDETKTELKKEKIGATSNKGKDDIFGDDLFTTENVFKETQDLVSNLRKIDSVFNDSDLFSKVSDFEETEKRESFLDESSNLQKEEKSGIFDSGDDSLWNISDFGIKKEPVIQQKTEEQSSKISKEQKTEGKSSIFDDSDDDDLFSTKKLPKSTKKQHSLFDDEDDDDDIFKSFTNTAKKTSSRVTTEKKAPRLSSVKKLENTQPDEDPLSALLK